MFDPAPNFITQEYVSGIEETAINELQQFQKRIEKCAQHYEIAYTNRVVCILDICSRLGKLLTERGINLRKRLEKEPIAEFQNLFQVFFYALGDQGLLYNQYGIWREIPEFYFWQESDLSYAKFRNAMLDREFAYLQLNKLRDSLKSSADYKRRYGGDKSVDSSLEDKLLQESFINSLRYKYLPQVSSQRLNQAMRDLSENTYGKQIAPLFLFLALDSDMGPHDAEWLYVNLKSNNKRFPPQKQPQQIATACKDWDFYCQCDEFLRQLRNAQKRVAKGDSSYNVLGPFLAKHMPTYPDVSQYNPYQLFARLCVQANLKIRDEEYAKIANYCRSLYNAQASSCSNSPQISQIEIGGVQITNIMKAFFTVQKSSEFPISESSTNFPRGLKQSLKLLLKSGILGGIDGVEWKAPSCEKAQFTNSQYEAIRTAALEQYLSTKYSFSQEVFWLITGYIPPYNYIPQEGQVDLYSYCFCKLHEIWYSYHQMMRYRAPRKVPDAVQKFVFLEENAYALYGTRLGIPKDLHRCIFQVRDLLASQWNTDIENLFLDSLHTAVLGPCINNRAIYDRLIHFAKALYQDRLKNSKTSFKSFVYAEDLLYHAILDECFSLTGIHLYQEVFGLLAALNQTLWPV